MSHPWTPEQVEALIKLLEEGLTATKMALRLQHSRNSVIGKIHRLQKRNPELVWKGAEERFGGVTSRGSRRQVPKPLKHVTKAARIKQLHQEHPGWTRQQIADLAGCDQAYIVQVLGAGSLVRATRRRRELDSALKPQGASRTHFTCLTPYQCRYPLWSGGGRPQVEEMWFCGERLDNPFTVEPYCEFHQDICYTQWQRKREAA